jgi:hypothetical protein
MICTSHQNYSGDKIEKDELGWACSDLGDRTVTCRVLVGRGGKETTWKT